ncbi:MAG TPA: hypothetical protein ENI33_06855 [Thermoplasmatales archaeon]|nr:hypothetical protein [Thermoplasmatales archaeon]
MKTKNKKWFSRFVVLTVVYLSLFILLEIVSAVDPPVLISISITPDHPTMTVGETLTFTATGYDQYGDPFPLYDPQWWANPQYGTLTVDPQDPAKASFTATAVGIAGMMCEEGGTQISGSTEITIIEGGELARIEITPPEVTLKVGEQQQFTAKGYDTDNNEVSISPIWSTTGGTITSNGLYTSTTPGDFTVTASVQGSSVIGTATVHIIPSGTTVEASTGSGIVYFAISTGTLENLTAVDETTLPEEGKPSLVFQHGFFSFNITGLTSSIHQKVNVTITLPSNVPVGTQYWKYHASEGWVQIPMGSDDGDDVITIMLEDGGLGDGDGECNGVIVDSGGPGIPHSVTKAPTLMLIGIILIVGVLLAIGAIIIKKRGN